MLVNNIANYSTILTSRICNIVCRTLTSKQHIEINKHSHKNTSLCSQHRPRINKAIHLVQTHFGNVGNSLTSQRGANLTNVIAIDADIVLQGYNFLAAVGEHDQDPNVACIFHSARAAGPVPG
jgi:hypothetical protein